MMKFKIKAADLIKIHSIHLAALGYGMFYNKPHRACNEIIGAEGTLFVLSGDTIVVCTMATRYRMIIHARIPCTNVDDNDGALFAFEAPKDFHRILRRFRDKLVTLKIDGSQLEIVLPLPGNVQGVIWLPLKRVNGHMLSQVFLESTEDVSFNLDLLLAALRRIPRNQDWGIVAFLTSDTGLCLGCAVRGGITFEQLQTEPNVCNHTSDPFVFSKQRAASFVRVLQSLRKHGQAIRVQISAHRIALWNDTMSVQIFADRHPSEWKKLSIPDTRENGQEIQLFMHRSTADIPKAVGKWLRRLIRSARRDCLRIETQWVFTRDLVTAEINCGLRTSIEIPCRCDSWPMVDDRVCLNINPLTMASMLESLEKDERGCQLVYRDDLLTIKSSTRSYQLTATVASTNYELITTN